MSSGPRTYYAFYSEKALSDPLFCNTEYVFKCPLASGNRIVECTSIYACCDYNTPKDVLKTFIFPDDVEYLGVVYGSSQTEDDIIDMKIKLVDNNIDTSISQTNDTEPNNGDGDLYD